MSKMIKKTYLTKIKKQEKLISYIILIITMVSIGILISQLIFAKLKDITIGQMDITFALFGVILLIEQIYRFVGLKTKQEKILYIRINKSELIYIIMSLIVVPLSFFLEPMSLMRWVIVFKLPSVLRRFNDEKVFQNISIIVSVILITFFVVPFLNVIAVSFSAPGQIVNVLPKNINLFALKYVLSDTAFLKSFLNSIFITVVGTFISVLSMAMAAYPLSKPDMPLRKTVLMFFMIVMLFSGGIAPNILLVNALGLSDTIWALIFPSVVIVYYMLLLKGFYESIPAELEESAKLDGASNFIVLFKIIMPIASPMIATVTFFTTISFWNNINNSILYITSNQSIYPVPMYIKNFLSRDPMDVAQSMPHLLPYWDNMKMGYILVSIIPIICAYPFIFTYLKSDVSAGAVKG